MNTKDANFMCGINSLSKILNEKGLRGPNYMN